MIWKPYRCSAISLLCRVEGFKTTFCHSLFQVQVKITVIVMVTLVQKYSMVSYTFNDIKTSLVECAVVDAWTSGSPHYTGEPTNLRRESANFLRARTRSMSSDMLSASISRSLSELDKPLLLSGSRGIHLSPPDLTLHPSMLIASTPISLSCLR